MAPLYTGEPWIRRALRWLFCYTLGEHLWCVTGYHASYDGWCIADRDCRLCRAHSSKLVRIRRYGD